MRDKTKEVELVLTYNEAEALFVCLDNVKELVDYEGNFLSDKFQKAFITVINKLDEYINT